MHDIVDDRGVPVSRGVPVIVRWAGVIGLIAIFAVGAYVILDASYGHKWPAASVLRVDLNQP